MSMMRERRQPGYQCSSPPALRPGSSSDIRIARGREGRGSGNAHSWVVDDVMYRAVWSMVDENVDKADEVESVAAPGDRCSSPVSIQSLSVDITRHDVLHTFLIVIKHAKTRQTI